MPTHAILPRRLLIDARFLHEKLSGLKNVRAPTAMLEIVVMEKRVGPQTKEPLSPQPQPQRADSLASPPPSTTSRFAHMFSRAAPSRSSTLLSPRPTTPVPAVDSEKALPAISRSPEPSSLLSDIAASPTPPVGTPSRPQSPAVSGHAQPVGPSDQTPAEEEASSQAVVEASPEKELVEDPESLRENGDAPLPPLPPAKPEKSSEGETSLSSETEPVMNGEHAENHEEKDSDAVA